MGTSFEDLAPLSMKSHIPGMGCIGSRGKGLGFRVMIRV